MVRPEEVGGRKQGEKLLIGGVGEKGDSRKGRDEKPIGGEGSMRAAPSKSQREQGGNSASADQRCLGRRVLRRKETRA